MILRCALSLTFLLLALGTYALGRSTGNWGFFIVASACALGSIGHTARVLLTYRGDKRQ